MKPGVKNLKRGALVSLAVLLLATVAGCGQKATTSAGPAGSNLPKVVNIGTNQIGSAFNAVGTAVASVASKYTGMEAKVVPLTGSTEWIPMMSTKEIDLGVVGGPEAQFALLGKADFDQLSGGKGFAVRLVAAGHRNLTPGVASFPVKGVNDLKGKRVVGKFVSGGTIAMALPAFAAANLNFDLDKDIINIPASSMTEGVRAVIEGRADATLSIGIDMPVNQELEASKGAFFIPYDNSPEAVARAQKVLPVDLVKIEPGPGQNPLIKETMWVPGYTTYLIVRADLPEEAVYQILKAMWEHNGEITGTGVPLDQWTTQAFMATNPLIPYHEGAIKFYREIGQWQPEMDQKQAELLDLVK